MGYFFTFIFKYLTVYKIYKLYIQLLKLHLWDQHGGTRFREKYKPRSCFRWKTNRRKRVRNSQVVGGSDTCCPARHLWRVALDGVGNDTYHPLPGGLKFLSPDVALDSVVRANFRIERRKQSNRRHYVGPYRFRFFDEHKIETKSNRKIL